MSEVDFQNGLVVGLTLAGKNGAVGGVQPSEGGGSPLIAISLTGSQIALASLSPTLTATGVDYPV